MPPSSPDRRPPAIAPDAARWIASVVLTVVVAAMLLPVGVLAGATGFAPVALIVVIVLVLLAVLVWRRAILAIAMLALSLSAGVALGGARGTQVAPSTGTLVVAPLTAREVDGHTYRRGIGGVILDLRDAKLPAGRTTRIAVRADSSRVVVALPRGTCVAVRLNVRPLAPNPALSELSNWTRSAGLGDLSQNDAVNGPWFAPSLFDLSHPDDLAALIRIGALPADFSGYVGPPGIASSSSQLFGRSPSRAYGDDFVKIRADRRRFEPFHMVRTTAVNSAAILELNVAAAGPVVVRDYPAGNDVSLNSEENFDATGWPFVLPIATAPEVLPNPVEWQPSWPRPISIDPARALWAKWERTAVGDLHRIARLSAGSCASRAGLRDQWQTTSFGGERITDAESHPKRLFAVNGLGELMTLPAGAPVASGTPEQLAAATHTHLLDATTAALRLRQYAAANLVTDR